MSREWLECICNVNTVGRFNVISTLKFPQSHFYVQTHIWCKFVYQYLVSISVLQLTLERRHRSCAQGHRILSWLQWPQAGSRSDWDIASAAGGGSHSPQTLWDCPSRTSVSCNLPNIWKTSSSYRYMETSDSEILIGFYRLWYVSIRLICKWGLAVIRILLLCSLKTKQLYKAKS